MQPFARERAPASSAHKRTFGPCSQERFDHSCCTSRTNFFGIAGFEQNRSAAARWREKHQTLALGAVQANRLAAGDLEPPGMIMRIAESVGAPSRLPRGIHAEVDDPDVGNIDGVGLQRNRIKAVMDCQCFRCQSVARGPGE